MEYKKIKLTMNDIVEFNNEDSDAFKNNKNAVDNLNEELNTKLHDILEKKGYCTVRELFGFGSSYIGWVKEEDK